MSLVSSISFLSNSPFKMLDNFQEKKRYEYIFPSKYADFVLSSVTDPIRLSKSSSPQGLASSFKNQQISPSSCAVDSLDICKTFQVFALSCFPKMTFVLTHEKSPSLMRLKVYVKCRSSINDVALKRNPFLPYNLLSVSKKKNAAMSLQFIHLKYLPK